MSLFRVSSRIYGILQYSNVSNILKRKSKIAFRCRTLVHDSFNKKHGDFSYNNENDYEVLTVETYKNLYSKNEKAKEKVERILSIYEHQKYTDTVAPNTITETQMKELLTIYPNEREITRHLRYLFIVQCRKKSHKRRKAEEKAQNMNRQIAKFGKVSSDLDWDQGVWSNDGTELQYGLWRNSLFSRISVSSLGLYRHRHLSRPSAMFGQKLIVDLDYDQYMESYEARLLSCQIGALFYENRMNRHFPEALPFDVHFTNCSKADMTLKSLNKHIKKMDELEPYFHQGSYLDHPELFPRDKLIYLSPHAQEPVPMYEHDKIYIIGGYNDRSTRIQASHTKAKNENIVSYRLPLDENVLWRQGSKVLCLNQVALILQAAKVTNDWRFAIQRFAPQRKLKSGEEIELENAIRKKRMEKRIKSIKKSYEIKPNYFA